MLEKLNMISIRNKQKFSIYELELFIELLNNHINWNQTLEIMNLKNDDLFILNKIDKSAHYVNEISQNYIPKIYRIDWIIKRTINKKWLIECFNKSFMYPLFLWLLSLNLMTFLVIYILPSTLETFNSFSNSTNSLTILMIILQFIIGFEWGVLLLGVFIFYSVNNKKITKIYMKLYKRHNRNLLVNILSFNYLFDLLFLLKLDISMESIMNILKSLDQPMYFEISDNVQTKLRQGNSIKQAFTYLDLTFLKLITIDDFERKINDRISQHLNILKKQIEIGIKKYATIYISIVYLQIGIMVFMVYSVLLYPLKLLEGMNL